jgi:hypothetical protein
MAEDGQIRDKSSHRTPKQIDRQVAGYNHQPKQRANRVANGKAREMIGLKVGDPRDAHHVKPLREGGATTKANVKAVPRSKNRAWRSNP